MCLLVKSKLSPMLAWQELLLEHHIEAFTWDNLTTLNNLKDAGPLLALLLSCDTPLHFFFTSALGSQVLSACCFNILGATLQGVQGMGMF